MCPWRFKRHKNKKQQTTNTNKHTTQHRSTRHKKNTKHNTKEKYTTQNKTNQDNTQIKTTQQNTKHNTQSITHNKIIIHNAKRTTPTPNASEQQQLAKSPSREGPTAKFLYRSLPWIRRSTVRGSGPPRKQTQKNANKKHRKKTLATRRLSLPHARTCWSSRATQGGGGIMRHSR